MEGNHTENLRRQLELLKKDLAKKQKKIKKIERAKSAKDHVRRKIEEQQCTAQEEDISDIFTQNSLQRKKPLLAPGNSLKSKQAHVSFNIIENESEKTKVLHVNSKNSQLSTTCADGASTCLITSSQDDFKDSPKVNWKTIEGPQAPKQNHDKITECEESNIELAQHVSKTEKAANKVKKGPCQAQLIKGAGDKDDKELIHSSIEKHNKLTLSVNSSHKSTTPPNLSNNSNDLETGLVHKAANVKDSERTSPGLLVDSESMTKVSVECSPRICVNETRKDSGEANNDNGQKIKKKRGRRSASDLDFSFLYDESCGDMYSQIKSRQRRSASLSHTSSTQMFGLSQEDYVQDQHPLSIEVLMPHVGQWLSQADTQKSHSRVEAAPLNPPNSVSLLSSPNVSKPKGVPVRKSRARNIPMTVEKSPVINSCPSLPISSDKSSLASPVPASYPASFTKRGTSKSKRPLMQLPCPKIVKELKEFCLPEQEYGLLMEFKSQISADSQTVSVKATKEKTVHNKLFCLPQLLQEQSDFSLPDDEYEQLKKIKVQTMDLDLLKKTWEDPDPIPIHSGSVGEELMSRETTSLHPPKVERRKKLDRNGKKKRTSSSVRRKSLKLSPILKDSDNNLMYSSQGIMQSDSFAISPLNKAIVGKEESSVESTIQRKVKPSQRSIGRKKNSKQIPTEENTNNRCPESELNHVDSCASDIPEEIFRTSTQCKRDLESAPMTVNKDLDLALLTDSTLHTSISQDSSQLAEEDQKNASDVNTVKLPNQVNTIHDMDAMYGFIGTKRATVVMLASSCTVQLWCHDIQESWTFLHEWEMDSREMEQVRLITTGDIITGVVLTNASLDVVVYTSAKRAWQFGVHEKTSKKLLFCKLGMSIVVSDVTECDSMVTKYDIVENWQSGVEETFIGLIEDPLVSLKPLTGQSGALVGVSSTHAYIWNHMKSLLLKRIELPTKISTCLSTTADHGLVFLWVKSKGEQLPSLHVANPNSAKCLKIYTLDTAQEQCTKITTLDASMDNIITVSGGKAFLWDASSGELCSERILTEKISQCKIVHNSPQVCVTVSGSGYLQLWNAF